jgi:hypothetical protein
MDVDYPPFSELWARYRQSIEADEVTALQSTDVVAIIKV